MAPSRRRLLAFAIALATLTVGALGLSFATNRRITAGGGNAEAVREGISPTPRLQATRGSSARRVAARFARAYLRYETGRLDRHVRRSLRVLCAPRFATELLGAPPRLPPGASLPRLRFLGIARVEPTVIAGEGAVRAGARLKAGGRTESLAIDLDIWGERWTVTGIGR
jgi:hypothetical protein